MSEPLRTENRESAAFSDRVRAVVIALATLSLVASIVVLVFGRDLTPPPAQPRDSYGRGALGHRAWVETLEALGVHVVRWTRADYRDVTAPLFLVEPDRAGFEAPSGERVSIADLCASRSAAGRMTVIVLPKWVIGPFGNVDGEEPRLLREILAGTPFESAQLVWQPHMTGTPQSITASSPIFGERHLEIPWPQTVIGPTPILSGPSGTFIATDPTERVFLIADPDLIHNFDVQRGDHAAIAHELVTEVLRADTIVVDEVFHEHIETRSLAQLFARFPGVLALVHGGLLVVVVLLYGRRRFGPPRSEPAPYGRGPREVIDVAAEVLASGQSVERLAPRYVEQVILDTHRRLGLGEGRTLAQKAAALDAVLARRGMTPEAVRLLETSQSATRETALAVSARATRLRESLLGAAKKPAPRERPVSIPPPPPAPPPSSDGPSPPTPSASPTP